MRFIKLLYIASRIEFQHTRRACLIIIMIGACMLLFSYGIMIRFSGDYNKNEADEIFGGRTGNTAVMISHVGEYENMVKTTEKIRTSEFVRGVASANMIQTFENAPYADAFDSETLKTAIERSRVGTVHLSGDFLDVFDIELYKGERPENLSNNDVYTSYLYLGYDYKDQSLGEIYTKKLKNGRILRYVVAGVFEKNTSVIPAYVFTDMSYTTLSVSENLDSCIVSYSSGMDSFPVYVSFEDGLSVQEIRGKCDEIAKEYGVLLSFTGINEKYEMADQKSMLIMKIINRSMLTMIVVAMLAMLGVAVIDTWQKKRQYGLLFSIGMSVKDLNVIELIRKGEEIACAFLLSWWAVIIVSKRMFFVLKNDANIVFNAVNRYVLLRLMVFASVALAISFCVSVVILHSFTPAELLEREE